MHAGREHFDEKHARGRYDAKEDAHAVEEVALLQEAGLLGPESTVVDLRHSGEPVDLVCSRYALHHLPDFWKAIALSRIAGMLRPGGALRLWDVAYSFEPADAEQRIEAWIAETMSTDVERGWTRAELAEHVRDEHSTFTWLLEPMIEHAGFDIVDADRSASGVFARYRCRKR